VLVALAALLLPSVAQATFPGQNGRIAFDSDRLGGRKVFTTLSGVGGASLVGNGGDPAWSADGVRIAVDSGFIYDTDGAPTQGIPTTPSPAWSPDGTKIAYVGFANFNSEIFVLDLATRISTRLTTNPGNDFDPAWSPDGTKIAFATVPDFGDAEIYTMDPQGGNLENVTDTATNEFDPNWSPDGTKLLFTSEGAGYDVFSMNADGSGRTRLTTNPANDHEGVWSPDGTAIAFQSRRGVNTDVFVMNADGTNEQNVTSSPADDTRPDWQAASATAGFTVNSTDDADDGLCTSSHCSLREAISASNAGAGPGRIRFEILPGGPQTIRPQSELPAITDEVVVDGGTQPGFVGQPLIEIEGSEAGPGADGLTVSSEGSLIRGVLVNGFGGFGIRFDGGRETLLRGNYIGVDHSGTEHRPNEAGGIRLLGSRANAIGELQAAQPVNVISSAAGPGIVVGAGSYDTDILGDYIGLRADGTGPLGGARSAHPGVLIEPDASNTELQSNVITGNGDGVVVRSPDTRLEANRIGALPLNVPQVPAQSGNAGWGVRVEGPGVISMFREVVMRNQEGGVQTEGGASLTDSTITLNSGPGIRTGSALLRRNGVTQNSGNGVELLAGHSSAESNFFSNNGGHGVVIEGVGVQLPNSNRASGNGGAGIAVRSGERNTITPGNLGQNGGLGIDLEADGVTLNDETDADPGANGRQNFPVVTEAVRGPSSTTVTGYLQSRPNSVYRIHMRLAAPCEPSGHGEWNSSYGAPFNVTTDSAGRATFSVARPLASQPDASVVATATDLLGSTSEISRCRPQTRSTAEGGTLTVNTPLDVSDGPCSAQHCTLREAIEQSNAAPGAERIAFALPGGVTTIRPASALPPLTGPVVVDGTSQPGHAGTPLVRLDGTEAGADADGLVLAGGFSTVKGFVIQGFSGWGLTVRGGPDNRVGGPAGDTNRIMGNGLGGVRVLGEGALEGNFTSILQNSIDANTGLGIDLEDGANRLQNAPFVTQVATSGGTTRVEGVLEAEPARNHVVELFDNSVCDPSGFGEGSSFLESFELTTGADGRATFERDLAASVPLPNAITATATGIDGAGGGAFTSEFSACGFATTDLSVAIADTPDPAKVGKDLRYTVTVRNEGPSDATGVDLRVAVPPHGGKTSTSFTQGSCTRTGNLRRCDLGELAAGAEATVRITVKPKARGVATATATVTAALPPDTDPANDTAIAHTTVGP
jgi:CSLREA domain-containing protein/uncharacterized repeat protein (TIGR01451 family)